MWFRLVCIFLFLIPWLGCTYSNLGDRPDWAKQTELPEKHPLAKKYQRDRYITMVVTGTGKTFAAAKKNAEEEANAAFAKLILTQVTSIYQSQTSTRANQYRASVKKEVESFVKLSARQVLLSGLRELLAWDGYEEEKIYYFACYALDKIQAGNSIEKRALQKRQELEELARELDRQGQDRQRGRLALQAIQVSLQFQLLYYQAQFFERDIPVFKNIERLKQKSLRMAFQAINQRMEAGGESNLEEALKFAEECTNYTSSQVLHGKILAIKRKLPCLECKFSGKCIQCTGKKGELVTCPTCRGNGQVYVTCATCRGDGKQSCSRCNGTKGISQRCNKCRGRGKLRCPTCRGKGWLAGKCGRCRGRGKFACTQCRGQGRVYNPYQRRWVVCPRCAGRRVFVCPNCRGQGRVRVKCTANAYQKLAEALSGSRRSRYQYCNGTGRADCDRCQGRGQERVTCPQCQGTGRHGTCPRCNGSGRVIATCSTCPPQHKGKVWRNCSHCQGKGLCPVCKGKGHRD